MLSDERRMRWLNAGLPKLEIKHRQRSMEDKRPYHVSAYFPDGRAFHAIGETPSAALYELAAYWKRHESGNAD